MAYQLFPYLIKPIHAPSEEDITRRYINLDVHPSITQWRRHSRAWQGVCPAKNASALPAALSAALAVKALIRLFIKCKIIALWLTELR